MGKKRKEISAVDSTVELFLKKNRVFTKTQKIDISTVDNLINYVYNMIHSVEKECKYIIFQLGIPENSIERFLYTDDTYVFIFMDENKYEMIKQIDYTKYKDIFTILFYANGILTKHD